jgi:hypothetical protein
MGTRSSSSSGCKALLSWVTTGLMLSLGSIATSRAASAAEGAGSGPCEEVCLEGFMDTYLDALGKHDPSLVPTAPHYRYTENGAQIPLGEALWVTFNSLGKYRHDVADPGTGGIATFVSLLENHEMPFPDLLQEHAQISADQPAQAYRRR